MRELTRQLKNWQRIEWLLRILWSGTLWFALALIALTLACAADWIIDRRADTPFALRIAMTLAQIAAAIGLAWWLFTRLDVPSLDVLAGRAEEAHPEFDHRLVTALQLNRPEAKTQGMSSMLLKAVTREAQNLSAKQSFLNLADGSRLEKAAIVAVPLLLIVGVFGAFKFSLMWALVQRQCLLDVPIPRSVSLAHQEMTMQPAGEPVKLFIKVKGAYRTDSVGRVVLVGEEHASEAFALKFVEETEDGALFAAEVPSGASPFEFKAYLLDGRTHTANRVEYSPRPFVKEYDSWLLLPDYVDPQKQTRYERKQPQGEVTALPDCGLIVKLTASKRVKEATLVLLSRPDGKNDKVLLRQAMTLDEEQTHAEARLELLPPEAVGYRLELKDDYDLANSAPPRRGIGAASYKAPAVQLLAEILRDPDPATPTPDRSGPMSDFAVDGMPISLERKAMIGYHARSPLGIARVEVWYRVNSSDWDEVENQAPGEKKLIDFRLLNTMKIAAPDLAAVGRFRPEMGLFEKSGKYGSVECYLFPAADPTSEPAGIEASGRYVFATSTLTKVKKDGSTTKLAIGDQVEFVVRAWDRRPGSKEFGESQSRLKAVVTESQLQDWNAQNFQCRGRFAEMTKKQLEVYLTEKEKARLKP